MTLIITVGSRFEDEVDSEDTNDKMPIYANKMPIKCHAIKIWEVNDSWAKRCFLSLLVHPFPGQGPVNLLILYE